MQRLKGQAGWLVVSKGRQTTSDQVREDLLLACVTDNGAVIERETVDRMFLVPGRLEPTTAAPPASLQKEVDREADDFGRRLFDENERWLNEEEARLRAYARDLEVKIDLQVQDLEEEMEALRKERRSPDRSLEEKWRSVGSCHGWRKSETTSLPRSTSAKGRSEKRSTPSSTRSPIA